MPVIKRYPNRKLYDTEAKRYITLGEIARLIRQGEEVQVIDHATGEDLTALTLTQIIFEQEKRRSGFLPQDLLAGLIQSGGETLSTLRHTLVSSLGLLRHVDEEIERRIQVLVNRGELTRQEGLRLRDKLLSLSGWPAEAIWPREQDVERALIQRGVPTREDLQRLSEQLEALAARLESLSADSKGRSGPE